MSWWVENSASDNLVVTDTKCISRTWVVSFNNRKYVETGDLLYGLAADWRGHKM